MAGPRLAQHLCLIRHAKAAPTGAQTSVAVQHLSAYAEVMVGLRKAVRMCRRRAFEHEARLALSPFIFADIAALELWA
jgi:hypothetical protein